MDKIIENLKNQLKKPQEITQEDGKRLDFLRNDGIFLF
jgi:hypothetical protein